MICSGIFKTYFDGWFLLHHFNISLKFDYFFVFMKIKYKIENVKKITFKIYIKIKYSFKSKTTQKHKNVYYFIENLVHKIV